MVPFLVSLVLVARLEQTEKQAFGFQYSRTDDERRLEGERRAFVGIERGQPYLERKFDS